MVVICVFLTERYMELWFSYQRWELMCKPSLCITVFAFLDILTAII
jgi:hypothetical protein